VLSRHDSIAALGSCSIESEELTMNISKSFLVVATCFQTCSIKAGSDCKNRPFLYGTLEKSKPKIIPVSKNKIEIFWEHLVDEIF
jgi:hypothetical protein